MKRLIIIAVCSLVGIAVAYFTIVDLVQLNKCTICQEGIIGKPERIHEAPVCDRCYSIEENKKIMATDMFGNRL